MKRNIKKLIAILMAAVLFMQLCPLQAFAAQNMDFIVEYPNGNDQFWVSLGESVTLEAEVIANDLSSMTFRWGIYTVDSNGEPQYDWIAGTNSLSYTAQNVQNQTIYCFEAADVDGNAKKLLFYVYIDNQLNVTLTSESTFIVDKGASVTLSAEVSALNMNGLTLEWYKTEPNENNEWIPVLMPEVTGTSYTVTNIQKRVDYELFVRDCYGNVDRADFSIFIADHLSVTYNTGNGTYYVQPGEDLTLEAAVSATDLSVLSYEWYYGWIGEDGLFHNELIPEATTNVCQLNNIQKRGYYQVIVRGSTEEQSLMFYVYVDNGFSARAANGQSEFYVSVGDSLTLSVEATANDPSDMKYTWYRFEYDESTHDWAAVSELLPGETGSSYTTSALTKRVRYSCNVEDRYGNLNFVDFYIIIQNEFEAHAKNNETQILLPPGGTAVFEVEASGGVAPITYQWSRSGFDENGESYYYILDCVSNRCVLTDAKAGESYWVHVEDSTGNYREILFTVLVDNEFSAWQKNGSDKVYFTPGDDVTLEVEVTGLYLDGVTYQWCREYLEYGWELKPIDGETSSSFTIHNVTANVNYFCYVKDKYGNDVYVGFYLEVENHFQAYPENNIYNFTVSPGTTKTLKVITEATVTTGMTFQWKMATYDANGYEYITPLTGVTTATYTPDPITANVNYCCTVTDCYGSTKEIWFCFDIENHLNAYAANHVDVFSVTAGTKKKLTVTVEADYTSGMTYAWSKLVYDSAGNTSIVPISAAKKASYTTTAINYRTGYCCTVTDSYGKSIEVWFDVSVNNHLSAPEYCECSGHYGEALPISPQFTADDTTEMTYQWYDVTDDGLSIINGATSATYTIPSLTANTSYYCEIRDRFGNATATTVFVNLLDDLVVERSTEFFFSVNQGDSVTMSVSVTDGNMQGITYTWYRQWFDTEMIAWRRSIITEAETSSLTIQVNKSAYYVCEVQNPYGHRKEVEFCVSIENHLIVNYPQAVYASYGETATIEPLVSADDLDGIQYQWRSRVFNEQLGDFVETNIPGATERTLTVPNVTKAAYYTLIVTDKYGNTGEYVIAVGVDNHCVITLGGDEGSYRFDYGKRGVVEFTIEADDMTNLTYAWTVILENEQGESSEILHPTGFTNQYIMSKVTSGQVIICEVTDIYGNQYQAVFSVSVENHLEVGPADGKSEIFVPSGGIAPMTVEVTGDNTEYLTYSWTETYMIGDKEGLREFDSKGPSFTLADVTTNRTIACTVRDRFGNDQTTEFTLTIVTPEITAQPQNTSATMGDTASFSVDTNCTVGGYQWQVSKDGGSTWSKISASSFPSAVTPTLTFPTKDSMNGYQYRCVISFTQNTKITSEAGTLTVIPLNKITTQPKSQTLMEGKKVTFTVAVSGVVQSYQWQVSKNGGQTWSNISSTSYSSAATKSLSFTTKTTMTGYCYRCKVTFTNGDKDTSEAAVLTVLEANEITQDPGDVVATTGDEVGFYVGTKGEVASYQWQTSKDGGSTWSNISLTSYPSAGTELLTFTVKKTMDGYMYRCKVTFGDGTSLTSGAATLNFPDEMTITEQTLWESVKENTSATFSILVEGNVSGFQWEVSKDSGSTWSNVNTTTYPSAATSVFTFKAKVTMDGYLYRCKVTSKRGSVLYSEAAVLYVEGIKTQPTDKTITAGKTAKFTVVASNTPEKYQWQVSKDGGATWKNVSTSSYTSAGTATFKFAAKVTMDGYQYRCKVTYSDGTVVTSKGAELRVFGISSDPSNETVTAGTKAKFTVVTSGSVQSYQWQVSKDGGSTWKNVSTSSYASAATATFRFTAKATMNGYYYRCKVTFTNGDILYSKAAKLTVQ